MPDIKGLEGLRGLNEISEEERNRFMLSNAEKLKQYANKPQLHRQAAEILYNNLKFKDTFGEDAFNEMNDGTKESYDNRNKILHDYTISKAFKDTFENDEDYPSLVSQLDTQGMYDLMEDSGYLGTQERKKRLESGIKAAKNVAENYDVAINNPYTDVLGAGYMQFGKTSALLSPQEQDEKYAKKDREIKERLFSESQERREASIADAANLIYDSFLKSDSDNTKTLAQSYEEFDKFATEHSPHYATFKDSKWLKDYSHEDRLKDYAKYQALRTQYGDAVAIQYLDRDIQNRVAEAQDWKWTGNTLMGVASTLASDLGSNVALFRNIGKSQEDIAILNQGKDPNKPIYDNTGQIVDYEKNENIWTNPAYWNDIYKYNTFSPTEINTIKERGGISDNINIKSYGYTPDFVSFDTFQEGFKQGGHIVAGIIETGLTGSLGKGIGLAGKTALKTAGLSAKSLATAAKVGNITNDLFVMATTGVEGAQLEAMGTFEEQLQTGKEKIQQQIQRELRDYYNTIDFDSRESRQQIDKYYRELKAQNGGDDGVLMNQAKQLYANQLVEQERQRLEDIHRKDELEAAKTAAKVYGANFIMDYVKNVPLTVGIQKFKVAKGSLTGAFDNTISKNIIADAESGGVKRATSKFTSAKNVSKELAKQLGAGFTDEYLDGINASFASGIGNSDFSNYINKSYNPELYNAAAEGLLGNMLSGLSAGIDGLTDRQNLYEGFIGMIAPVSSVMINPNAAFTPKDTWRAVVQGTDASGKELNLSERLSGVLMNPLLNTYNDLVEKDRVVDSSVDAINTIISQNKDKLNDASKIISALDDYSSPIVETKFKADDQDVAGPTLLDSKDSKLYNAFTLVSALSSLENINGGGNSLLYQNTMKTLSGLANGTFSDVELQEEIDEFISDPDNKSILDQPNGREIAAERLQKNASYLLEMKNKLESIYATFAKSIAMRDVDPRVQQLLAYNIAASDDYEKRLVSITEELGLHKPNTESEYVPDYSVIYGTAKARKQAVAARDRMLKDANEANEEIQSNITKSEDKINELKASLRKESGQKRSDLQENIRQQEDLIKSYKFQQQSLREKIQTIEDERNMISSLDENIDDTSFSGYHLLDLDVRDLSEVLNPDNKNRYSKKQQQFIDFIKRTLLKRNPDALRKIHDAGILSQRIADLGTVHEKLMSNDKLAATYLDATEQLRNIAAMAESLQQGIDEHYSKIEKAYNNRFVKRTRIPERRQQEFKNAILNASTPVIDAYMQDHPEQVDEVKPYHDMLQFEEDAASIIRQSELPDMAKVAQLKTIALLQDRANSKEELQSLIEGLIDFDNIDDNTKQSFDSLLSDMQKLGYQRNSSTLESRRQRKEREAAEQQKKEKAREKIEKEVKAATEKPTSNNIDKTNDLSEKDNTFVAQQSQEQMSSPIVEEDDNVVITSASIDEQLVNGESTGKEALSVSEETNDAAIVNGIEDYAALTSTTTLSGNAMSEYQAEPLQVDGILKHKEGKEPNDAMNRYNAWMRTSGIKLQNIIDTELSEILKRNPEAKVKFMAVRPEDNATKDIDMKTHLMLVLDYDDSINKGITSIHNSDNGGIIDSLGKKYLVIGTVGYGNKNADRLALYDILFSNNPNSKNGYGLVKRGMGKFFRENPSERFYIPDNLSTQIVSQSLIPGYIVKQLESDEYSEDRSIMELLNDSERNPYKLSLQELAWGIQEKTKFLVVGTNSDNVMMPMASDNNIGSAFVLVPASNGKMVPAYIKPLFYNEMNDGELKNKIDQLLVEVTSPDYSNRLNAVIALSNILHFDKDANTILLRKNSNEISLVSNGNVFKTFVLGNSFDRTEFMKAFSAMNPRINITAAVLQSNVLLKQYNEAGALQTDIASIATAGSSYRIYGLDSKGNMIIPENNENTGVSANEVNDKNRRLVFYNNNSYVYNNTEEKFYLNGAVITDTNLIEQLQYNRRIIESDLSPVLSTVEYEYYILSSGENPEAVKRDKNTKVIKVASRDEALKLINKVSAESDKKIREENVKEEVSGATLTGPAMDVDLGIEFETAPKSPVKEMKEGETPVKQPRYNQDDNMHKSLESLESGDKKGSYQTFSDLIRSKKYRNGLMKLIRTKWPESPKNLTELDEWLRNKNIETKSIGIADSDVEAWIKTIQDCR